jgi:hypothetical protein
MALCSDLRIRGTEMAYRISAVTHKGSAVSVIVETAEAALAKIAEYREDGFSGVGVRDIDGAQVDPDLLLRDA